MILSPSSEREPSPQCKLKVCTVIDRKLVTVGQIENRVPALRFGLRINFDRQALQPLIRRIAISTENPFTPHCHLQPIRNL